MDPLDAPDLGGGRAGARPSSFATAVAPPASGTARGRTAARRSGGARQAVRGGGQYDARWKGGAEVADAIARCGDRVAALPLKAHAAAPRSPADRVVVAPTGIFVVKAARFTAHVVVEELPLTRPRLLVGGIDRTELIEDVYREVGLVIAVLGPRAAALPVRPLLGVATPKGVLADSVLPAFRPLTIGGCPLLTPARLARRLVEPGPLTAVERTRLARILSQRLSPR